MRIKPLLREIFLVAIIILLVPAILAITLGWKNSVIPILIWFQFLLIWIQAEIALRQQALFAQQFKPSFDVEVTERGGMEGIVINLKNISSNPAYNVMLRQVLDSVTNPVPPKYWKDSISLTPIPSLPPGERRSLCRISPNFDVEGCILEVDYDDVLDEPGEVYITFLSKEKWHITPGKQRLPGFLLRRFESMGSVWRLWRGRIFASRRF